jgi:PAS domain
MLPPGPPQVEITTPADTPTTPSPITDPRLQEAFDYWRQQLAGKAMPRRADIDPLDIPKLLPHVMVVEVLPSGRYRYRLIGTENTDAQCVHATGRYLDEVLPGPEYKAHVLRLYDECVRSCHALYSECLFISPQDRTPERHIKVVFLPLSEDGLVVNQVLVVQVYFYMDPSTRDRPRT